MKNLICLLALACAFIALPAQAQLGRGDFRLSLDTDVLSVAHISIDPDGPVEDVDTTVFGVGPNQLGGSHATMVASPLGLGLGWVITPKLLIGARLGLGFDVISPDGGDDNNVKVLAMSLMPGLTWVPIGRKAKLFLDFRPLFQVNRAKTENRKERWIQGGFSTGIGALIFPASPVSVDLGFHFEGRFGGVQVEVDGRDIDDDARVRDLRGVVRLGISLWK